LKKRTLFSNNTTGGLCHTYYRCFWAWCGYP
jgi:hypothetical protein